MWEYNYTISPDELYHHKYIAKIGSGKKDELDTAYKTSQKYHGKVQGVPSEGSYKYGIRSKNFVSSRKAKEKAVDETLRVLNNRNSSDSGWTYEGRGTSIYSLKSRDQKSHNNNDYDELKRASDNYKEAKTVKGKVNAARKVFNQYHPETAKRINKGRKKLRKLLGY
jgi:hypothetical protein